MNEADANVISFYRSDVIARVDTGKQNIGPAAARLGKIHPAAVIAAEIVDDSRHELDRIMCFQKKTLKTLNGKRG
ncbi:hypothetical protein SDC9_76051 [bioreactor metagenome]|uniref:Uncharacterized protein n=1 Tax=bioreactor metagenome TaxID=1076179 RepID=A0A644YNR2_9ZZZZ